MSTQSPTKTLALEYVKTIGILNLLGDGRGFCNPVSIIVGKDGRIFILNRGAPFYSRVGVMTFDDEYLYEFGTHGDGDGQFRLPAALGIDSHERIYVADEYHHRISVFGPSGEFESKWGQLGSGDGQIDGPCSLAVDAADNVYVADQNNHRIQKFTPGGDYILKWGEFGDGDGQLNLPWGIKLDAHGDVYVADWRNDRIQKFTPEGEFLAKFGESGDGDGQLHRPSSVAVDPDGNMYVADWGNERVQVLGPDGGFLLKLRGQATHSKWAEEYFTVNTKEGRERKKANLRPKLPPQYNTPFLVSSYTEPYFMGIASMDLDDEGRLYVLETARDRMQIFQRA